MYLLIIIIFLLLLLLIYYYCYYSFHYLLLITLIIYLLIFSINFFFVCLRIALIYTIKRNCRKILSVEGVHSVTVITLTSSLLNTVLSGGETSGAGRQPQETRHAASLRSRENSQQQFPQCHKLRHGGGWTTR